MGQYHIPVNLDKREYLDPHKLGAGLKQWEQIANAPGTGAALQILLFCSNGRGGGDLDTTTESARAVLGRWAGDRIAIVGDYAEFDDLAPEHQARHIYYLCRAMDDIDTEWMIEHGLTVDDLYADITDNVCSVIEAELNGKFVGDGWRHWQAA